MATTARHPRATLRRKLSHRVLRFLRDLRVSALLSFLTLLPVGPSAYAGTTVRAEAPDEPVGRARAGTGAYIIHVPGIAGPLRIDHRLAEGLVAGGAGGEVEIFDWVGRRRGFGALFGEAENHRQARRLAEHILDLKRADPGRPLVITAHSGGTAIVAWALELVPELAAGQLKGAPVVDGVILIASGLSPQYDLSPMMGQVAGRVFHLSSTADNLILGAGTLVFGTLDRKYGVAAGKTGFVIPADVAAAGAYERYAEVPYDRAWVELGHYGDHEGMMSLEFGRSVMSDLVRASLGEPVDLPTTRPAGTSENEAGPATRPTTRPAVE